MLLLRYRNARLQPDPKRICSEIHPSLGHKSCPPNLKLRYSACFKTLERGLACITRCWVKCLANAHCCVECKAIFWVSLLTYPAAPHVWLVLMHNRHPIHYLRRDRSVHSVLRLVHKYIIKLHTCMYIQQTQFNRMLWKTSSKVNLQGKFLPF